MARTVTVGVDGSHESLAAADWAAREALRRDLGVRLLHAWEWLPRPLPDESEEDAQRHWATRALRQAEQRLTSSHPDLRVTTRQVSEGAVSALIAASAESELVVLGSRGLSGLAGFLVGSVSLAVAARASCPVVMVRAGEEPADEHLPDADLHPSTETGFREIVLGLDPAHRCDPLIEFAFDTAARRGAALRVVHTWIYSPVYGYSAGAIAPDIAAELQADARRALSAALRPWREKFPGVDVEETVVAGRPGQGLVFASSGAGLLVVGRRNRPRVGGHLGPVAHAVLHHASCPVAVVPHD